MQTHCPFEFSKVAMLVKSIHTPLALPHGPPDASKDGHFFELRHVLERPIGRTEKWDDVACHTAVSP